jgi:fibronectin-binding autotransporter adhesin
MEREFWRSTEVRVMRSSTLFAVLAALAVLGLSAQRASAQTYTWTPTAAGAYNWSDPNWDTNPFVGGSTVTANLTANIAGAQTIALDAATTLNMLNIGSATASSGFTVTGTNAFTFDGLGAGITMVSGSVNQAVNTPITLASTLTSPFTVTQNSTSGSLSVGGNITANGKNIVLAGAGNMNFGGTITGGGTLTMNGTGTATFSAANALNTGNITVNSGTLGINNLTLSSSRTITIGSGAFVASSGTIITTSSSSVNPNPVVTGAGTLQLTSTNSSATNPDINFNSNDATNSTANWGTQIAANLDLGSSQRYIWGRTNHNGVVQYGLSADCVFTGTISGSGGMTFIAQATYTGGGPMEVPFYLTKPNTFTGMVEIQRGSVYLGDNNALAQGNVLLLDPAAGNNARLFLYGHNASVSNLSSSGAGNALITNAPGGTATVAAATLTVTQNSDGIYGGLISQFQAEYTTTTTGTYGALSIVKNGSATLTFSNAANSYTGSTTINAGTLSVTTLANGGSASSIGASTNVATNLVFGGGTLSYTGGSVSTDRSFTVNSPGGTIGVASAGTTLTFSGLPTGSGTLTKIGPGALVFSSPFNTDNFTGTLAIDSGNGTFSLGGLTGNGPLTQSGSGTLAVTGSTTLGFGGFGGNIVVNGGAVAISGQVSGFGGGLTKSGSGLLSLTNATNSYSGTTAINAGTLRTVVSSANGAYSVAGGATFAVDFGSSPSTMNLSSLSLANGSSVTIALGTSTNPSSGLFNVTSANGLTLAGTTTVNLSNTQAQANGTFTLFQYSGTPITGGFTQGSTPNARTLLSFDYSVVGQVNLTVQSDSIIWTGALNGNWDVGSGVDVGGTNNWKRSSNSAATNFFIGDTVIFNDSATGTGPITVTVSQDVTPGSVTVNNSSRDYIFTGSNKITGTTGLLKTGSGSLTLANPNDFTGGVTVSAGTLQIGNGGTTGSLASDIVNNSAVVFNRSDAYTYSGAISGSGTLGVQGSTTLTLTGNLSYSGNTTIATGSTLALNPPADTSFGNAISGGGNFTKAGSAALTLTASNGYTGVTTFAGGFVVTGALSNGGTSSPIGDATSDAGNLIFDGGGLRYTGSTISIDRGFTLNSGGGTIDVSSSSATLSIAGNVAGSGNFTKAGAGVLVLNNAGSVSGNISVTGGTLSAPGIGSATGLTLSGGSTYQYTGSTASSSGAFAVGTGGASVDVASGTTLTFSGSRSGAGTLTKTNSGVLALTGSSTGTGGYVVNGGDLQLGPTVLSSSNTATIAFGASLTAVGTIGFTSSGSADYTAITGTGTLNLRVAGSSASNPDLYYAPEGGHSGYGTDIATPINLGSGSRWVVAQSNNNDYANYLGDLRLDGAITGSSTSVLNFVGLPQSNDATLVLKADNSASFLGSVNIVRGNLALIHANALTAANNVTFSPTGTNDAALYLFGQNATIGNLSSGAGTGNQYIRNGSSTTSGLNGVQSNAVLTVTQTTPGTFSGIISDGPDDHRTGDTATYFTLGLNLAGSSALTLTGNNTYTGGTTIAGGTLLVNNTAGSGTGTGSVSVNSGTLGGTGTITPGIGSSISVNNGGTLAPGANGAGTLKVGGNVTIANNGTFAIGLAAGGSNTSLSVQGSSTKVNFATGSILSLSALSGFDRSTPSNYTLITMPTGGGSNLMLDNLPIADGQVLGTYIQGTGPSGPVTINTSGFSLATGDTFTLSRSGDSVMIAFSPVPEPATVLGIAAAALGLGGLVRRRFRNAVPVA